MAALQVLLSLWIWEGVWRGCAEGGRSFHITKHPAFCQDIQRYHKDITNISQSAQQRHGVDLVYFWYHSPWILNIKVRSCVLYPCIIRRYPKGKYLVQMLVQQKGFTKLISLLSISLKGFFMFYKFRPSLQVEIICTH